ncbi:RNI-like protein [Auricularia subglabra TFB-10046 SS5]|nr:RNI-like protein [Auricularia subglabra TFB-10046 SS5]
MPPKRKSTATRAPSRKRRRVSSDSDSEAEATGRARRAFGADNKDDEELTFGDATSIVSYSTRTVPTPGSCQSLSSLAIRVAANSIATLFKGTEQADETKALLLRLPEHLVARLFAQLRIQRPTLLNHTLITTYFLRGDHIVLNSDLPGVGAATIAAIPRLASADTLRGLELTGFSAKILSDEAAGKLLAKLPALERLVLRRDCKAVGPLAVASAAKHCPNLVYVNLSNTQASTDSIVALLTACTRLETVKLANVPHLSKTWLRPLLVLLKAARNPEDDSVGTAVASRIANLKLRATQIRPDAMYRSFLAYFPNLRRLDLSHTNVHFTAALSPPRTLEKLSVYNTPTTHSEILDVLPLFAESMRTLNIAHLASGERGTQSGGLGPDILRRVTDKLVTYTKLERLTITPAFLDLGTVRDLKTADLVTLVAEPGDEDEVPALEHLVLSNSKIDDDAAPFIAACRELRVLDVESTLLSSDGVFQIISKCEKLASVNVTGCRRVKLQDRRRIFDVSAESSG